VEADGNEALARGMQGLCVRLARRLNRLMGSRGRVFADHYHSRPLRSPTELVAAIRYVLGNYAHHFGGRHARDRFSSAAYAPERRVEVLARPRTWLVRHSWLRARRL